MAFEQTNERYNSAMYLMSIISTSKFQIKILLARIFKNLVKRLEVWLRVLILNF